MHALEDLLVQTCIIGKVLFYVVHTLKDESIATHCCDKQRLCTQEQSMDWGRLQYQALLHNSLKPVKAK